MAEFHEISLAATYYVLFSGLQKSNKEKYASSSSGRESQSAGVFWEEDNWTPEEEEAAERRLRESRERCHIRSNAVVPANEKDDEQAWNKFYSQHHTNFFKVRNALTLWSRLKYNSL